MKGFLWTIAIIAYLITLISLVLSMASQSLIHFMSTGIWLLLAIVATSGAGILQNLEAIRKNLTQQPK